LKDSEITSEFLKLFWYSLISSDFPDPWQFYSPACRCALIRCCAHACVARVNRISSSKEKYEKEEVRRTVGDNRYVCSVTARTSFFRSSSLFAFVLRTLDIARENRLSRLEKFQRQGRKRTHVYFSFLFNRD